MKVAIKANPRLFIKVWLLFFVIVSHTVFCEIWLSFDKFVWNNSKFSLKNRKIKKKTFKRPKSSVRVFAIDISSPNKKSPFLISHSCCYWLRNSSSAFLVSCVRKRLFFRKKKSLDKIWAKYNQILLKSYRIQ